MSVRRPLLLPLAPLFRAGSALRSSFYSISAAPVHWLEHPVISVGSISAGGAGKTPFVLLLAEILAANRYGVSVLTRGYGRNGSDVDRVDASGDPAEFGDEPVLLAQRLAALPAALPSTEVATGRPARPAVFVGKSRYLAGKLAESGHRSDNELFHILDDGFQHRQLGRDVDIVMLTEDDLHEHMLPAGNLREPLTALDRADLVVVRAEEKEAVAPALERVSTLRRKQRRAEQVVWTIRRCLHIDPNAAGPTPQRPFLFSGIARPENFSAMLKQCGVEPSGRRDFADHHAYGTAEIARLVELGEAAKADGWMTTEKDAVKLTPAMVTMLEAVGPLVVPRLNVDLESASVAMHELTTMVDRGEARRLESVRQILR